MIDNNDNAPEFLHCNAAYNDVVFINWINKHRFKFWGMIPPKTIVNLNLNLFSVFHFPIVSIIAQYLSMQMHILKVEQNKYPSQIFYSHLWYSYSQVDMCFNANLYL